MISFKKATLALIVSAACIVSSFACSSGGNFCLEYEEATRDGRSTPVDLRAAAPREDFNVYGAGHQLVFNTETLRRFLSTKSDPDSRGHDADRVRNSLKGVYSPLLNNFSGNVSDLKAALESAGPIVEVRAIDPRAAAGETANQVLARIAPRRPVDPRLREWASRYHEMARKDGHFVRADEAGDLGAAARYSAAELVEMGANPDDYVRVGKKGTLHPFEVPGQIRERRRAIAQEAARKVFSAYGATKHYLRMGRVDALKAENDDLKAQIAYLQAQLAAASAPKE